MKDLAYHGTEGVRRRERGEPVPGFPDALRVGLLTPYTGGNLGDGAIQDALIAQIRGRFPGSLVYAFTLDPKNTERLHHVPSFPLTSQCSRSGRSIAYRSFVAPGATKLPVAEKVAPGAAKLLVAKRAPSPFSSLCSRMAREARRLPLARLVRLVLDEAAHTRNVYRLCRGMDLLIASGGGQLDDYWGGPWGHPYALFKWSLLARLTGTRFLMLSLGTCSLNSRLSRLFVRQALKHASYRSYRDETSKKLLERASFTKDDPVFPDLAFSYPIEKLSQGLDATRPRPTTPVQGSGAMIPGAQPDGGTTFPDQRTGVVGVSPIAYLSKFGWPERDDVFFRRYLDTLGAFVSWLMDEGHRVLFFATASADHAVVDQLMTALRTHPHTGANGMSRAAISTVGGLFSRLPEVDCVVASRLHGVLLSHIAGKPVLAISYDRKVDTYMKDMGQAEYCLNIHDLDGESLKGKFSSLRAVAGSVKEAIAERAADYRSRLDMQYDRVLARPFVG